MMIKFLERPPGPVENVRSVLESFYENLSRVGFKPIAMDPLWFLAMKNSELQDTICSNSSRYFAFARSRHFLVVSYSSLNNPATLNDISLTHVKKIHRKKGLSLQRTTLAHLSDSTKVHLYFDEAKLITTPQQLSAILRRERPKSPQLLLLPKC